MKTNITKLQELYGMQSHTAKYVKHLLLNHLPYGYSSTVVDKAKKEGRLVSNQTVRLTKSLFHKDIQIFNLIIDLAKKNEAVAEAQKAKFKKLTCK